MPKIKPELTAHATVIKALTDTALDAVVDTVVDSVSDVVDAIKEPSEPGEKPACLAVVVPMYNEAATITPTLDALRAQTRPADFILFCNNASTDDTADVVDTYIREHALPWTVIDEHQKGTGAASDTAVRTAIARGATHIARTDADCLPAPDWLAQIDRVFTEEPVQMIAGMTYPRTDDTDLSPSEARLYLAGTELAILYGKVRPSNLGDEYQGPYVTVSGNNMAITAALYERAGGFPRTRIDDVHEDHELIQAVRRITDAYTFERDVKVYVSARRAKAWGLIQTLEWYRAHKKPDDATSADIREP